MLAQEEYVNGGGNQCPVCKSTNIEGHRIQIDSCGAWQDIRCNKCNAIWTDIYKLDSYDISTEEGTGG